MRGFITSFAPSPTKIPVYINVLSLLLSIFCVILYIFLSYINQVSMKKKIERKSYEEVHSPLMVFHKGQPCLCMCVLQERFMRN